MTTTWAVTALRHPGVSDYREPCRECLALVDAAITDATVTGSVGATRKTYRQEDPPVIHSATVHRAIEIRETPDQP